MQGRNRETDVENKPMDSKRGGRSKMNWKVVHCYVHCYVYYR